MRARIKPTDTWISRSKNEIENEEELLACRRIILKIVRYMKDNKMSQKDLADKLNVSPQYVNKLLHGQDLDLKITTVLRYGRILGINLIVLPEDEPAVPQLTINCCHFETHMGKLSNVSFDEKYIYAEDAAGRKLKQSILWYPALANASEQQRNNYTIGITGFHWKDLDEDISFESFEYDDAVPSVIQEFFLLHKEINVAEFAKRIGLNPTLLRNYINGFKKPSAARESEILDAIHQLGKEYCSFGIVEGYSQPAPSKKQYLSDSEASSYSSKKTEE